MLIVSIVGAGFAGLATAALLARAGHAVTVFEKFSQPRSVGAGILIQPSGLAAMRALGIADEVLAQGAPVRRLYGVTPTQHTVIDVHYDDWQSGAFGLGLHRGVLFDALWRLCERSGVKLVTGHEATDLAALQANFDLVVVSDGARSALRAQTGLAFRDRQYPWGAVWAVLDDPGGRYGATLWQWYRSAREMLGIMPTGQAPGHASPVVSLFWSLHEYAHAAWLAAGLEAFKRQVLTLNPGCADLLAQIRSLDQLTWARYRDVSMPAYHAGHCVVIGDAAHATSPQLGQGTNLALLDAVALARCLVHVHSAADVPAALAAYTQSRRPHLRFYGQASRWMTPAFQSRQTVLPWLRDAFMEHALRWPVSRPFSHQTLVGVRSSWWRPAGLLDLAKIQRI
jgi:2-polyprenyl-6-methoxyphenol hydroxylase-like FAD-dependent oxidoreductase